ncbi:hypothetical protein KM043_004151 [Ampulex compressa]|nr:hypothetical protein KM043_004151 [Ampulex compressa]
MSAAKFSRRRFSTLPLDRRERGVSLIRGWEANSQGAERVTEPWQGGSSIVTVFASGANAGRVVLLAKRQQRDFCHDSLGLNSEARLDAAGSCLSNSAPNHVRRLSGA